MPADPSSRARHCPVVQGGGPRPDDALPLAGGPLWFAEAVRHTPGATPVRVSVSDIPTPERERLSAARTPLCGLSLDQPRIMGILNVTPDSFSDGGRFLDAGRAVAAAEAMAADGADILDIGGESTRPGAEAVSDADEAARVLPVIAALRAAGFALPISVDTRKPHIARAAIDAGADLWNDVSALGYAADAPQTAAALGVPVCLMHAKGDPRTMQDAPAYEDVLLEVAWFLEARIAAAEAAGLPRDRMLVDPGIGFGKTVAHNLSLISGLAMLHGTGCAILFGASRKRFIGALGAAPEPTDRLAGSLAVALEALRHGAQVIRVHDVAATRQAVALWSAMAAAR